jgi:hypothetical protein
MGPFTSLLAAVGLAADATPPDPPLTARTTQLLDDGEKLLTEIDRHFHQVIDAIKNSYLSPSGAWAIYRRTVVVFTVLFFGASLLSRMVLFPEWPLRFLFVFRIPLTLGQLVAIVILWVIWIILTTLPANVMSHKVPSGKEWFWGIQDTLIVPLSAAVADLLVGRFVFGQALPFVAANIIVSVIFYSFLSLALAGIAIAYVRFFSFSLFLFFSRPLPVKNPLFIPAQPALHRQVLERSYGLVHKWDASYTVTVRSHLRERAASLTIQMQTMSSLFGLVGLLGVLAVIFTQDQVQAQLARLAILINGFFRGTFVTGESLLGAATLLIGGIVLLAGRFILTFYTALRTLEVADLLLSLRGEEAQAEEKQREQAAAEVARQQREQEIQRQAEALEQLALAITKLHQTHLDARPQPRRNVGFIEWLLRR